MLPSADGQEQVMRKAYQRAGLEPNATDYVEVSTELTPTLANTDL